MKEKSRFMDEAGKSVLLIPAVAVLLAFFIFPICMAIYYSFSNLALSGEAARNFQFVGLDNYRNMFKDRNVKVSIINTLIFLVGSLAGQQFLGFSTALLMKNCNTVVRRIVGPIILSGWVMPEIVVALCCTTFFDANGTMNKIIGMFGIAPLEWLFTYPLLTVILANIWQGTAFSMLNYQSALDGVSAEIEEAARVDGASRFQSLVRIIIPCVRNTIGTNVMLNTLSTLGVSGLIYAMTGGGPGTATLTLPIQMYRQAFISQQLGYGTAISMIILALGIMCSIVYTRMIRSD